MILKSIATWNYTKRRCVSSSNVVSSKRTCYFYYVELDYRILFWKNIQFPRRSLKFERCLNIKNWPSNMYYFSELLLLSSLRLNFFAQSGLEIFPLFFKHRDVNLNYFSPLLISRIWRFSPRTHIRLNSTLGYTS